METIFMGDITGHREMLQYKSHKTAKDVQCPRNLPLNQRDGNKNESELIRRAPWAQGNYDLFRQMYSYFVGACL